MIEESLSLGSIPELALRCYILLEVTKTCFLLGPSSLPVQL